MTGLKGEVELIAKLKALAEAYPEACAAQVYEEALAVDADMVPRIPVDTGRLRSTHYVSPPETGGGTIVSEVGVGTDYAVYVHERTEVYHAVGEAKFLEKALLKRAQGMLVRMARGIEAKVRKGIGVNAVPSTAPRRPGG